MHSLWPCFWFALQYIVFATLFRIRIPICSFCDPISYSHSDMQSLRPYFVLAFQYAVFANLFRSRIPIYSLCDPISDSHSNMQSLWPYFGFAFQYAVSVTLFRFRIPICSLCDSILDLRELWLHVVVQPAATRCVNYITVGQTWMSQPKCVNMQVSLLLRKEESIANVRIYIIRLVRAIWNDVIPFVGLDPKPIFISQFLTIFMMTSSNGNIFRVTGSLCGEFTGHRWIPRTKASDAELYVFVDLRLIKRLSKQSWGWWFETQSRTLWRHCNEVDVMTTNDNWWVLKDY